MGWRTKFLTALAIAAAPAAATAQTPFEAQVLAALNAARANPLAFAAGLQSFRGYFQGASYVTPGDRTQIITSEGVVAVDDAIAALQHRSGMGAVTEESVLAAAAADHVAEQAASGTTGHLGANGSTPSDRAQRRGGDRLVAEVIEYGARDPKEVVRQLIVDDGVADRGHRNILLDPAMRFAGVSCGRHPTFRTMCVIVMDARRDQWKTKIQVADAGND